MIPEKMIRGFEWFSRCIIAIITIALAIAIFTELTGITIVQGMTPLSEFVFNYWRHSDCTGGRLSYGLYYYSCGRKTTLCGGEVDWAFCDRHRRRLPALANTIPAYGMMKRYDTAWENNKQRIYLMCGICFWGLSAFCTGVEPQLIPCIAGLQIVRRCYRHSYRLFYFSLSKADFKNRGYFLERGRDYE